MQSLIIDTNVLVRLLLGDESTQYFEAKKIIERIESGEASAVISVLVIDELIWAMEKYYDLGRSQYTSQLQAILGMRGVKIQELKKEKFMAILTDFFESKLDFTDLYLLHIKKPNQKIMSFDKELLSNA